MMRGAGRSAPMQRVPTVSIQHRWQNKVRVSARKEGGGGGADREMCVAFAVSQAHRRTGKAEGTTVTSVAKYRPGMASAPTL